MNNNELTYNELNQSDLIPHKWCSIDSSNIEDPEICFKLKVWKKQCEFGKQVLEFTKKMYYGVDSKKCLEDLINSKYSLQLLNSTNPKELSESDDDSPGTKLPVKINLFTILNQPLLVEVGTTISGIKTFNWIIDPGSYIVHTVDIIDVTNNSNLITNTANDGSESLSVNTITLNNLGEKQTWMMKANVNNSSDVLSDLVEIEAGQKAYYGAVSSLPNDLTDGAANRNYALNLNSGFVENGINLFKLETGITEMVFVFLIPDTKNAVSITDQVNMNLNILNNYEYDNITIQDAGGTDRNYKIYYLSLGGPYSIATTHTLKTD